MKAMLNEALMLLSEGLDLCVRAKKLDEAVTAAVAVGQGGGTRCLTPALWVQDAYDRDLADWEARARAGLSKLHPFVDHLPAPSGLTAMLSAATASPTEGDDRAKDEQKQSGSACSAPEIGAPNAPSAGAVRDGVGKP